MVISFWFLDNNPGFQDVLRGLLEDEIWVSSALLSTCQDVSRALAGAAEETRALRTSQLECS